MRSRLTVLAVAVLMLGTVASPAFATHYDNSAATGTFNPQYSVSFAGEPLVNRVGDLTIHATQTDHEDPVAYAEIPIPGQWQFPMTTMRPGEKPDATATNSCDDVVDGDGPDGKGDGTLANQVVSRAEIFGSAHAEIAASITRPGAPIEYDGHFVFISWDAVNSQARLCLVIQSDDPRLATAPLPPDIPVETVAELRLAFWLPLTTDLEGNPVWAAPLDVRDLVMDQTVQALDVSILDILLVVFGHSQGNWHAGGLDASKAPAVSGAYNFKGSFETCPENDPDWGLCKSGRGPITRNNVITIGLPAPAITGPANGAFINTHGTTITGTSDPLATVRLFNGATPLGDVTADGSGNWTTAGTISLAEGSYTVSARTVDTGGQSPVSNSRSFTIDTPPLPPELTWPADSTTFGAGTVPVSGTAQPGSTVRIYDGADLLDSTTTAANGVWSKGVTITAKGPRTLTATAADLGGEGEPSLPVAINITTATPVFTSPANRSFVNTASIDLTGTAEPGATVAISEGGIPVGSVVADGSGVFTLPLAPLEGEHTYSAVSTSTDAFVSLESAPHTITIDLTAPGAPTIATPADASVVNVRAVPFSGTAEPNATVVLRAAGSTIGSATADVDGNWSKSIALSDGLYTVDATARDRAGNKSPVSPSVSFEVDVPVLITSPAQDSMNPKLVTITVVGDVAATQARLFEGTREISRKAMTNGTATFSINMSTGPHTITARTLSSGQLGKPSAARTFTVDAAPPTVEITGLDNDQLSLLLPGDVITGTAADEGTGVSGVASIEVSFSDPRNTFVAKTTADCVGCPGAAVTWSVVAGDLLDPGVYTATVIGKDAMGNVSTAKRAKFLVL